MARRRTVKAKTKTRANNNSKVTKNNTTIKLRRSERIRKALTKRKAENASEMEISILTTDKESNIRNRRQSKVTKKKEPQKKVTVTKQVVQKTKSLAKSVSNVSSKSGNVREKFYNDIARDELYRDKININPTAYNKDKYGNLAGNEYDLAMDNAFSGFIIAVIQLYNELSFDFKNPKIALEAKGFKLHRWTNLPKVNEFNDVLTRSCQLWIISSSGSIITAEYLEMIKNFFDSGKGVYIWGDNDPYYADANKVAKYLFGAEMSGNVPGGQVVKLQKEEKKSGLVLTHLINTGLDFVFEGYTIATIKDNPDLEPVMYGSADNLVVATYNKDGKRAILDGGFTRLYCNWDTAGTGRYVKNAAAWLANVENIPI